MATAKISLEQLIDALIEGKKALNALAEAQSTLESAAQQKEALTAQVAMLRQESDGLYASLQERKIAMEQELADKRAKADADLNAYRTAKEAEMKALTQLVADAKRATDAAIERLASEEAAAKQATTVAQVELRAINEALDRARNDASKLARMANVARA